MVPQPRATAASVLAHLHVDVAAFVRKDRPPAHLAAVLACVASYRALRKRGFVRTIELAVHTNDPTAVRALVNQHAATLQQPVTSDEPGAAWWTLHVVPWDAKRAAHDAGARANNFLLAHAHLHRWLALVQPEARANATAFVHLEDDVCPSAAGLLSWAHDEALLRNSGASACGFQRGFYRFEVVRSLRKQ